MAGSGKAHLRPADEVLIQVQDLVVEFRAAGKRTVKAVSGISLDVKAGETLGLVGESGCGKSTVARSLIQLPPPKSGSVVVNGVELTDLSEQELRPHRTQLQMIFQDPAESLNSRHSVRTILEEPYVIHRMGTRAERRKWVDEVLEKVGPPSSSADRYSFEFSGGQRQRIGIARALALRPKLIVCDEPVSALDVSVQSQILNLLVELQREMGLSYLFIAHDLGVVKHVSDRVAVMYLGKIVELASSEKIYLGPKHAYTKALLSAIPIPDPAARREKILLEGDVPSPINPPEGSAFGHRIKHSRYEETIGMDLSLCEIDSGHWVAADPCCLEPEDCARLGI